MQTHMTFQNQSSDNPMKDMYCFWAEFIKNYKCVESKKCEKCTGIDELCKFYIPLKEHREEYIARN